LLGRSGLYAESGAVAIAVSAVRYAVFGVLLVSLGAVLAQLLVELLLRRGRARVVPVRSLAVAGYLAIWALFLFKQAGGAGAGGVVSGSVVALAALISLLLATREAAAPRRSQSPLIPVVSLVIAAAFLVFGELPAVSSVALDEAEREAWALEPFRPAAIESFAPGGWNVLLLSFDTLRADHLGGYGYERAETAVLDSLVAAGVKFENAIVQRPKTSPNVATFITGTYPARHGIHRPMRRLPERSETLAEILGAAGWRTGAVITNGNLYPEFGFDQGFEDYIYGHKDAGTGADRALAWLDSNAISDQPWHLWVHATDPHWPYSPPPEWEAKFTREDQDHATRQIALYDGEIAWTSEQTGRILDWLARHPEVRDRTLVIFTADHGESLGEHDYAWEHGMHPYEPSVRVPLAFSMPGRIPVGEQRVAPVGSVDLVPTILDAVGVPIPVEVQGHSLLPLVLGISELPPRDFVFLEAGYGEHIGPGRTRALRTVDTKYVRRLKEWALFPGPGDLLWTFDSALEGGLAPDEFYALSEDPEELHSLSGVAKAERERLDAFHRWLGEQVSSGAAVGVAEIDPETEASLRSLGYID
jgi:arylsulfatase A-like enzyme